MIGMGLIKELRRFLSYRNSIYDSHTWMAKYGDPGFHKHTAAAKILGLMSKSLVKGMDVARSETIC